MLNRPPPRADAGPLDQRAPVRHAEAELLRLYGSHSLAFLGLAPKNRQFLAPGGAGVVTYQLTASVAVVLGDPLCSPEACEQVIRPFLEFCVRQQWRVAFYQASAERVTSYHACHLQAFKMGEEAILHPQTFTLHGSALANVRTSCRRAEREGVRIAFYEGVPPPEVMPHLTRISRVWLDEKAGKQAAERGFCLGSMAELAESAERADMLAALSSPANVLPPAAPRMVTAVAHMSTGQPCAFVTFTPIYGGVTSEATAPRGRSEAQGWGWALDLMRRVPDAPPGVMELLLVRAIERFRGCGAQRVSLGLVALADTRQEMTAAGKGLARLVARLGLVEPGQTLFRFKQKFHPCWESRYLVANTRLGLPKIAGAVLRLRNSAGVGQG